MTAALRVAIRDSGLGYNALARESGVDVAGVFRFAKGQTTLTLESTDRLLKAFGLQVTLTRPRKGR